MPDVSAPRPPRYTVRSVARAVALVDAVAEGPAQGMTLTEMARRMTMSKSATYSLVRTLVDAGYLSESEPGPRYRLGLSLLRLGDLAGQQDPLADVVGPILRELAAQTGLTTRAAVVDAGYPVFVERVDGPGTVRFHTPLGRRELPHASSAGKAILAQMSDDSVRALLAESGMPRRTRHTLVDVDALLADLGVTRQRGYALDDEEDVEGVFCVGAAFFDHTGRCAGALSGTGIKTDLPAGRVEELGGAVRRYADRVTQQMGGRAPACD
jgi:IclR family transcriptional regulator, acetate operon repressor